jgi:hypothetical protein
MSQWWTYTPSDLQSFSLPTYYRLFERYNAAIWPGQIVALALGFSIGALLLRRTGPRQGRVVAGILACGWLWVAIVFHASRYADINWAAAYFAWGFGFEALLLLWTGVIRGRLAFERRADGVGRGGFGIFLFALAVQPLVGPLLGRGWRQIEIFGVAPDPTAVATLGVLLLAAGRVRWELIAVPAIWCAITGATLAAMEAPGCWIPPLAAALAVTLAAWRTLARRRTAPGTSSL